MSKRKGSDRQTGLKLNRRHVVVGGLAAGAMLAASRPMKVFAQTASNIRADVPGLDPKLAELYAKTKAAGETQVIYYGNRKELYDALNPTFTKRFPGIEFKMEPYDPTAGAARVLAEISRGPSADVFEGSFLQGKALDEREVFDTSVDWKAMGIPDDRIGFKGAVQTFHFLLLHAYNPKKLGRDQLPKTNADFLDPKWKGQIVTNDFQLTAHLAWWVWATKDFDGAVAWVNKLKEDQQLVITGTLPSSLALVTQGTKPLHLFGSFSDIENNRRQGADVDTYGTQHMGGVAAQVAVLKKARSPNAGALLSLWMQTDEAQGLMWDKFYASWGRGERFLGEHIKKNNIDVAWETRENYLERAGINGRLRKALGLA
ncbi:MAG: ABC transporter substrate-binding protein [Alphaproteobacteria bacterium]